MGIRFMLWQADRERRAVSRRRDRNFKWLVRQLGSIADVRLSDGSTIAESLEVDPADRSARLTVDGRQFTAEVQPSGWFHTFENRSQWDNYQLYRRELLIYLAQWLDNNREARQ